MSSFIETTNTEIEKMVSESHMRLMRVVPLDLQDLQDLTPEEAENEKDKN